MAKASDNPAYNADRQKLMKNNASQISEARQLDAAYQQSRKPIVPTMTTLKDSKKLSYKPGQSAGENWSGK